MTSIRVLHMEAPKDAPTRDLMIWKPTPERNHRIGIFQIPVRISDELAAFLGHPPETYMSRSQVTHSVVKYTKDKGLLERHRIIPDDALRALLRVPATEDLTILTLHRYLKPHFPKATIGNFAEWWSAHEESLWVGIDMTHANAYTFAEVYETIMKPKYSDVRFTLYTGITWADDSNSPCGCTGYDTVCDYHRGNPEDLAVAPCGCSRRFRIKCEYHV